MYFVKFYLLKSFCDQDLLYKKDQTTKNTITQKNSSVSSHHVLTFIETVMNIISQISFIISQISPRKCCSKLTFKFHSEGFIGKTRC